jgi:CcmD family protein
MIPNHVGSVVAAYMVIWGVLIVYQFTVSRRVSNLRQEVERLKETLERGEAK